MWIKSYSHIYEDISKEAVWEIWSDVNNYTKWHDDLDYCRMQGEFVEGNFFILKPKGAPAVKVKIIELERNKKFVDCTSFVGARMYDIHELQDTETGLRITSTVKVTGLLSMLWVMLVAKNVAASAPKEMNALVELVRKNNAKEAK